MFTALSNDYKLLLMEFNISSRYAWHVDARNYSLEPDLWSTKTLYENQLIFRLQTATSIKITSTMVVKELFFETRQGRCVYTLVRK